MNEHCICEGERVLLLMSTLFAEPGADLQFAAERLGWRHEPEVNGFFVTLGPDHRFTDLRDLADYLRGLLGRDFARVRAHWLEPHVPVEDQYGELLKAPLLQEFLPSSDGLDVAGILNQRRIETWFQPVLRSDLSAVWGYECLVRARDGGGGLIGAWPLIEAARQEHLTFQLDRVCRETHVANAGRAGAPPGTRFLINFLPSVIYEPEVCLASTMRAVRASGLRPRDLVFEVVETEQVRDHAHLRRILDAYRQEGFGVALDDVGSGYSGLLLLAELEPDLIKLDRALIAAAPESKAHASVCRSIAGYARDEAKLLLAEGVETEAEWEFVQSLGVDLVQGFLFGRPAPELTVPAVCAGAAPPSSGG